MSTSGGLLSPDVSICLMPTVECVCVLHTLIFWESMPMNIDYGQTQPMAMSMQGLEQCYNKQRTSLRHTSKIYQRVHFPQQGQIQIISLGPPRIKSQGAIHRNGMPLTKIPLTKF